MTSSNSDKPEAENTKIHYPSGDEKNGATILNTEKKKAKLTQIGQILQSTGSKDGFAKAKQDANRALAEKKIILNNRFVLESTIGAGGMGSVYKAQDLRRVEASDNNPYVAIKVLSGDFKKHPDAFVALQREASRSAKLSHPNIVTVYDFDRDNETVFMTMELLNGRDLDHIISEHSGKGIAKPRALKIISEYCQALSFAHQKGVIHCDLKPANIFLDREGAKVLDFGIARLAMKSQDHFDAGRIGAFTPGYASLEMFHGNDPDPSDDVFAAAIIAYELLAGQHPYEGKSAPVALGMGMQPKPIKGLSNRQWRALSKALQLEKSERTETIDEFVQGLIGQATWPRWLMLGSGVAAIVIAAVGYSIYSSDHQLKAKVEESLQASNACLQQADFACAISNANVVLKIEPQHPTATQLLQSAKEAQRQAQIDATIAESLKMGETCFQQGDHPCVIQHADSILALKPTHSDAMQLKTKAQRQLDQQQQAYDDLIAQASDCFKRKDFNCAVDFATQATDLNPSGKEANNIKQNAQYEIKQQQNALTKAKSIVADGRSCFKKFDYSCAIAKAESSLEFVNNYPPALQLKKDAEKAIANAKKSITIE